jgi:glycosyltransferase involved in cell wall biosynthesis
MGICSHGELEGEFHAPGLAILRRLPRVVFVNSRLLERAFGPLVGRPVYYTPNGVETTFFRPPVEPRERRPGQLRVGWAGSLANHGSAHRGLHEVIEPAVSAVAGTSLVTAVREERWRTRDEMLAFYRGLDAYICASLSEGTPNPCLEAAACGVPVVTTRVGNMPELIRDGENGFLVDRRVEDVAGKLALLRDSPALATRLARRMNEVIADWDWSVQAENYARMFDDLLR